MGKIVNNKLLRILVVIVVGGGFFLPSPAFCEMIDLSKTPKTIDYVFAAVTGYFAGKAYKPGASVLKTFAKTYLVPYATGKLVDALKIENPYIKAGIQAVATIGLNKAIDYQGAATDLAAEEGAKAGKVLAEGGEQVAEVGNQGMSWTEAFGKIRDKASGSSGSGVGGVGAAVADGAKTSLWGKIKNSYGKAKDYVKGNSAGEIAGDAGSKVKDGAKWFGGKAWAGVKGMASRDALRAVIAAEARTYAQEEIDWTKISKHFEGYESQLDNLFAIGFTQLAGPLTGDGAITDKRFLMRYGAEATRVAVEIAIKTYLKNNTDIDFDENLFAGEAVSALSSSISAAIFNKANAQFKAEDEEKALSGLSGAYQGIDDAQVARQIEGRSKAEREAILRAEAKKREINDEGKIQAFIDSFDKSLFELAEQRAEEAGVTDATARRNFIEGYRSSINEYGSMGLDILQERKEALGVTWATKKNKAQEEFYQGQLDALEGKQSRLSGEGESQELSTKSKAYKEGYNAAMNSKGSTTAGLSEEIEEARVGRNASQAMKKAYAAKKKQMTMTAKDAFVYGLATGLISAGLQALGSYLYKDTFFADACPLYTSILNAGMTSVLYAALVPSKYLFTLDVPLGDFNDSTSSSPAIDRLAQAKGWAARLSFIDSVIGRAVTEANARYISGGNGHAVIVADKDGRPHYEIVMDPPDAFSAVRDAGRWQTIREDGLMAAMYDNYVSSYHNQAVKNVTDVVYGRHIKAYVMDLKRPSREDWRQAEAAMNRNPLTAQMLNDHWKRTIIGGNIRGFFEAAAAAGMLGEVLAGLGVKGDDWMDLVSLYGVGKAIEKLEEKGLIPEGYPDRALSEKLLALMPFSVPIKQGGKFILPESKIHMEILNVDKKNEMIAYSRKDSEGNILDAGKISFPAFALITGGEVSSDANGADIIKYQPVSQEVVFALEKYTTLQKQETAAASYPGGGWYSFLSKESNFGRWNVLTDSTSHNLPSGLRQEVGLYEQLVLKPAAREEMINQKANSILLEAGPINGNITPLEKGAVVNTLSGNYEVLDVNEKEGVINYIEYDSNGREIEKQTLSLPEFALVAGGEIEQVESQTEKSEKPAYTFKYSEKQDYKEQKKQLKEEYKDNRDGYRQAKKGLKKERKEFKKNYKEELNNEIAVLRLDAEKQAADEVGKKTLTRVDSWEDMFGNPFLRWHEQEEAPAARPPSSSPPLTTYNPPSSTRPVVPAQPQPNINIFPTGMPAVPTLSLLPDLEDFEDFQPEKEVPEVELAKAHKEKPDFAEEEGVFSKPEKVVSPEPEVAAPPTREVPRASIYRTMTDPPGDASTPIWLEEKKGKREHFLYGRDGKSYDVYKKFFTPGEENSKNPRISSPIDSGKDDKIWIEVPSVSNPETKYIIVGENTKGPDRTQTKTVKDNRVDGFIGETREFIDKMKTRIDVPSSSFLTKDNNLSDEAGVWNDQDYTKSPASREFVKSDAIINEVNELIKSVSKKHNLNDKELAEKDSLSKY